VELRGAAAAEPEMEPQRVQARPSGGAAADGAGNGGAPAAGALSWSSSSSGAGSPARSAARADSSAESDAASCLFDGDSASWCSAGSVAAGSDETCSVGEEARRKVVLVTGGAGFIGSHTCELLLSRGDKVVVIDDMNDYYDVSMKRANVALLEACARRTGGDFVFCEGDICDRALVDSLFRVHSVSHVVHLAARAGVRPSIDDPFIYVQTNVMGTVGLLEASAQHGVANFVYASSSSVYGGSTASKFCESDLVDKPVSQYAATKKSSELFAATYHSLYGLNCTGLRFFTVYGPRGRPDMAPFKFIERVLQGRCIDQYGDGSSERDYSYVGDIARGVALALDKPLGCDVLNLGLGSPVNLRRFIGTVEELCGRKALINVMPEQPGDVPRTSADTTKAELLLGFKAEVSLEEGLKRTVDWYKDWKGLA
jgi:UDP-glucuronate 4-epimerase